ncbi:DUF547 domain-containing protein [Aureispira]|nr:DUF547 domain-containing protein [Aureispira sp.]
MKQLLFLTSLICLLALACSNALQEQSNDQYTEVNTIKYNENPSSDAIIAENLDYQKTADVVVTSESNANAYPKPISKPKKPVVTQTQVLKDPVHKKLDLGETKPEPSKSALSHEIFDELLGKYVNNSGGVDYNAFIKSKSRLNDYLTLLKDNAPESSWSQNKEMAYWINLYNAFTIHSILEKYPVSSIMDLEGGKVWDKKKIDVAGKSLTLNIIEKEKLLKRFKEPRIHFAVNCAAASCPPLLNKAWTEDNVQRYLSKQAKAFINSTKFNFLSSNSIEISQIFNWYAGDFGGSDKVVNFIQRYADTKVDDNASVKFKEYIWKLNKQ